MAILDYIYRKFINLGVFSRILLVIVKPLALWLSIQFDTDAGLALAQIYLIGLLFMSLSGTNAHRPFYQIYFGDGEYLASKSVARSYVNYIQKITLQLIFLIILLLLVASFVFWDMFDIVITGILFGIAEKLNDEFQRYAQFRNNSQNLFYLALSKLIPILIAALLSYTLVVDIRFAFPVLLLTGSIILNFQTIFSAISFFIKITRKSVFLMIKKSFNYIKQDVIQISCVFMGISLISFDKWLLQFFAMTDLPIYMLCTQIASIFIVTQTIILIAPIRARLVTENPQDIKSIKIGSPIISLISLLLGIVIYYYYNSEEDYRNITYFAFFFAAIITFSVAYTERLYWATTAGIRLALDSIIVASFIFSVVVLKMFLNVPNFIELSLGLLFCLMCIRVIVMIYMLGKYRVNKN
tara:strand:- start:487 stop:1719 length:1233 start_codon:yes stop_codon:yes gene_type:complete